MALAGAGDFFRQLPTRCAETTDEAFFFVEELQQFARSPR